MSAASASSASSLANSMIAEPRPHITALVTAPGQSTFSIKVITFSGVPAHSGSPF
jgi:hypothetical protein